MHQEQNPKEHITIDSIRELRELTEIKIQTKQLVVCLWWEEEFQRTLFKIQLYVQI